MDAYYYEFNPEKNALLKEERGISFEEVIVAIRDGYLLDVLEHPNKAKYGHQKIYIVNIDSYVYAVPFVESKKGIFLKTIFSSRKLTKQYLSGENGGKDDEKEN